MATHISPSISRSKGSHTMKLGQLIEHNIWTLFLKNHTQNVVEKLYPDNFLKSQNWPYLQINSLKFYAVCFGGYRNVLKLSCRLLAFTSYIKLFFSSLILIFEEKYFSRHILLTDQIALSGCLYSWDIEQYVRCNCLLTTLWRHKFWN